MSEKILAIGNTGKRDGHPLELIEIPRRAVGPKDVHIKVEYCGMCHSDLHTARQEWGATPFPVVPGHEVAGIVDKVGSAVTKFKVGDKVGVGCYVDSCRKCPACLASDSQYCTGPRPAGGNGATFTYNTVLADGQTFGGYSSAIVCDEDYVLRMPNHLPLDACAPLLCAGITLWSPMRFYGVKKGDKVAVLGLGGLGHMAVKLAVALGAKVTVLSRSSDKTDLALKMGAEAVLITTDMEATAKATGTFDFIFDTVSAKHDINFYASLCTLNGTIVIVGGVPEPLELRTFALIMKRIKIGGSLIGSIKETQEMLDFCGKHNITADIELIPCSKANIAYEKMLASEVKFRFVLDIKNTLTKDLKVEDLPAKKKEEKCPVPKSLRVGSDHTLLYGVLGLATIAIAGIAFLRPKSS